MSALKCRVDKELLMEAVDSLVEYHLVLSKMYFDQSKEGQVLANQNHQACKDLVNLVNALQCVLE